MEILFKVLLVLVCAPVLVCLCVKFGKVGWYNADQYIEKKKNEKVN